MKRVDYSKCVAYCEMMMKPHPRDKRKFRNARRHVRRFRRGIEASNAKAIETMKADGWKCAPLPVCCGVTVKSSRGSASFRA